MKPFLISIFLIGLFSCNRIGTKPMPINKMKVVIWDMSCADELFTQMQSRDSSLMQKPQERYKLYNQVFAIHKITKEQFYNDYQYYQQHTDLFKVLIDSVQSYGTKQRDRTSVLAPTSIIP